MLFKKQMKFGNLSIQKFLSYFSGHLKLNYHLNSKININRKK